MLKKIKTLLAVSILGLLASCSEDIISGLDQRDMLDAELALERAGIEITVSKDESGLYTLTADSSERSNAIAVLTNAGLPRDTHASVAEVFPGGGFLVTPFEQKVRMNYATEQQLSETLSTLDGVAEARVHIVLAEDNGRGLLKESARASALLKYRPGSDVAGIETKSRALLVNSIRGLAYEDVSVVASPWKEGAAYQTAVASLGPASDMSVPAESMVYSSQTMGMSTQKLTMAAAILMAIAAALMLLVPQRKES
jgi:type III secretion protein J